MQLHLDHHLNPTLCIARLLHSLSCLIDTQQCLTNIIGQCMSYDLVKALPLEGNIYQQSWYI
jgi:hypothetical protein